MKSALRTQVYAAALLGVLLLLAGCRGPVRHNAAETKPHFIHGYTDQLSYAPGEQVVFHMSSNLPHYQMVIKRIGLVQEQVWRKENVPGKAYEVPADASSRGCDWPEATRLTIPTQWKSGYYEVFLGAPDPRDARKWLEGQTMFFVVRAAQPGKDAKTLLQLTTNTYNAYNSWGGYSLYRFNSRDGDRVNHVSFHRPILSRVHEWELPFIQWAERNGYALEYAVNSDLEVRPELLGKYKLVVSVGHDEYWSGPMRDTLDNYIARGGNVAFLGGNNVCWQVRFIEGGATMVSYKFAYEQDPLYNPRGPNPLLTTLWSHDLIDRPENRLTGVGFLYGGMHRHGGQYMNGSGAFTVHRSDHWVFEGTDLKPGDAFGGKDGIIGYECDGCELAWIDGKPIPTHRDGTPENFVVLATAPARWPVDDPERYDRVNPGGVGHACMGIYTKPGGGSVFTASTTNWAHGLRGNDPAVIRITRNVLDRLSR